MLLEPEAVETFLVDVARCVLANLEPLCTDNELLEPPTLTAVPLEPVDVATPLLEPTADALPLREPLFIVAPPADLELLPLILWLCVL